MEPTVYRLRVSVPGEDPREARHRQPAAAQRLHRGRRRVEVGRFVTRGYL